MLDSLPEYTCPLVVGIGAATVTVILTPIIAPAVLSLLGFGAVGPVAGTAAAGIQAGIGNVAAGSLFATAQSISMGGAALPVFTVISAGVTGLTAAAVVTIGLRPCIRSMYTAAASAIGAGIGAVVNMMAAAAGKFGPIIVSFAEDAASTIGRGIDAVANMAGEAAAEYGPSVLSKGEAAASAMGEGIGVLANKTAEAAAEYGPGVLSKGEVAASVVGEGIGVLANKTAAAAEDLKPSIISISNATASAIGAGIGAIASMTRKDS